MYFHNFSKQQTTGTSAVLKHYYQNSYRDYSIYSGKMQTRYSPIVSFVSLTTSFTFVPI